MATSLINLYKPAKGAVIAGAYVVEATLIITLFAYIPVSLQRYLCRAAACLVACVSIWVVFFVRGFARETLAVVQDEAKDASTSGYNLRQAWLVSSRASYATNSRKWIASIF